MDMELNNGGSTTVSSGHLEQSMLAHMPIWKRRNSNSYHEILYMVAFLFPCAKDTQF
jgi:hypothetical protein